jgi:hypothetical protein
MERHIPVEIARAQLLLSLNLKFLNYFNYYISFFAYVYSLNSCKYFDTYLLEINSLLA